jgi:antitoxin ParD1/3/4
MNVTINPEFEEFVRRKLESGRFASAEEVVTESLRELEARDQRWRKQIEEGWHQSQNGQLVTPEEAKEWLAKKKMEWKRQHNISE